MTGHLLQFRLAKHRGYISNQVESQPTGAQFTQPGHSLVNMKVTVIVKKLENMMKNIEYKEKVISLEN